MRNSELNYKLDERGFNSLSDSELIEVATGTRNPENIKGLLKSFNHNLREIAKLSLNDLMAAGLTKREANVLLASMEIGRRKQIAEAEERIKITSSKDAFDLLQPILGDLIHEEFWVLFLNRANRVIGREKMSQGGLNGTVTDVRLIMKKAIEKMASGLIVCHNHPSGNMQPSEADTRITQKIKEAGGIMDIQLLDHVIIAGKDYYSFGDDGLL